MEQKLCTTLEKLCTNIESEYNKTTHRRRFIKLTKDTWSPHPAFGLRDGLWFNSLHVEVSVQKWDTYDNVMIS